MSNEQSSLYENNYDSRGLHGNSTVKLNNNLGQVDFENVELYDNLEGTNFANITNEDQIKLESRVRQAAKRGRKSMPKDHDMFVLVAAHLLKNAHMYFNLKKPSVLQKKVLQKKAVSEEEREKIIDEFKQVNKEIRQVHNLKGRNRLVEQESKVKQIRSKYQSFRKLSGRTGIPLKTVHDWCSKPKEKIHKAKELSNLRRAELVDFLMQDSITFPHPCKKHSGRRFMRDTWDVTREKYLLQPEYHKYGVLALSTMKDFRPDNILLSSATPFANCLCDYCENVNKNLRALRKVGFKGLPSNKYDAVDVSVCDFRLQQAGMSYTYPSMECILGDCPDCGVDVFAQKLIQQNQKLVDENEVITWRKWQKPKGKSAPDNVYIRGTTKQCLEDLFSMMKYLTGHLFRANWHRNMYEYMLKQIIVGFIVQIFDYSMNFRNTHQNEVQSAYWNGTQTTIHSIINHLKCLFCDETITLVLAQISDDLQHDSFHARSCHTAGFKYLAEKGYPMDLVVQFCDNCAGQYKSRRPFAEIARSSVQIIRVFFGEKHGKSECDGFFGRIKRWMTNEVKTCKVTLNCAKDFYEHAKNNYPAAKEQQGCQHYKVVFQYIPSSDVRRRHDCDLHSAVKGTRKLYSVRNTTQPLSLLVRNVPCLCPPCIKNEGVCLNGHITDNWREEKLQPANKSSMHDKRPHPTQVFGPRTEDNSNLTSSEICENATLAEAEDHTAAEMYEDSLEIDEHNEANEEIDTLTNCDNFVEVDNRVFVDLTGTEKISQNDFDLNVEEDVDHVIITGYEAEMSTNIAYLEKKDDDVIITAFEKNSEEQNIIKIEDKPTPISQGKKTLKCPLWLQKLSKKKYWHSILTVLQACEDYAELESQVKDISPHIPKLGERNGNVKFIDGYDKVDEIALVTIPPDAPQELVPVSTYGDGNCLCRALSHAYFGDPVHHLEIRARIVIESIVNRLHYTHHACLSRGVTSGNTRTNLPQVYAEYSDLYENAQLVNEDTVMYMFCQETYTCSRPGAYMGLWQFASAAEVLQTPIHSVYPCGGDEIMRKDFHRTFFPLKLASFNTNTKPIVIMWTSPEVGHSPNHFVPLLEIQQYVIHEYPSCKKYFSHLTRSLQIFCIYF